ncbi:MAG: RecQ family ATP-dependent DNA helicase [Planctomycetota bacterium]
MKCDPARALALLRAGTQIPSAVFRDGQDDAIRRLVENKGRLLVVQKTGWGKSAVYFIATKLLREQGRGPALLVSPLLSLMRNQIAAAQRMGVRAAQITSENQEEWDAIAARVREDEVDLLLISPERLTNERFQQQVLSTLAPRVAMLVIDEAHCVSDWGHDFRPHYRLIERIARTLPSNTRLLATTATANDRVMDDLKSVLGPKLVVLRGDLNRPSLHLQTLRLPSQTARLAWLAQHFASLPGSGIVYTLTMRDAETVASWLRAQGHEAVAYTSETEGRAELEDDLLHNRIKALVATTALGMGFDKPDLGFVVHYQTPGSVVAYYQQVGRAGRAIESARGVLLSGKEETDITDWFIRSAFPTREEVQQVLGAMEVNPEGLSVPELMACVNITKGRIEKTLQLLSLEQPAPIVKDGTRWQLTVAQLSDGFWERADRLTELRRREQEQMQRYVGLQSGHMEFLIEALDGDARAVQVPKLVDLPSDYAPELAQQAAEFLRRTNFDVKPRKAWPAGGLPKMGVKGKIAVAQQASPGKALCSWGDAGYGELVRRGKYTDGRFADELVDACAKLVRGWKTDSAPTWVTCIPSLRHPELVPDFAQRLASALGLPFHPTLEKTDDRPEQKAMKNSTQQAHNVDGSLSVRSGSVVEGPVLLVDDMVDSGWTFTVAASLLREHGSGPVYPLALAQAGHDE